MRKLMGIMVLAMVLVMAGQAFAQPAESVGSVTVSDGELSISVDNATFAFPGISMTDWFVDPLAAGYNAMEPDRNLVFTITNTKGADNGWSLTLSATKFNDGGTNDFIIDSLDVTAPDLASDVIRFSNHGGDPADWTAGGGPLLADTTPTAGVKVLEAAKNEGRGVFYYTLVMDKLILDAFDGVNDPPAATTYTSTITATLAPTLP